VFENFERRRLRPGDVDINCVIAGGGLPVLLLQFLRLGPAESGVSTSRRKCCRADTSLSIRFLTIRRGCRAPSSNA